MIYVFEQGEYEDCEVKALFEGPPGLNVGLDAFLASLGLRPAPEFPRGAIDMRADQRYAATEAYSVDRRAWDDERMALLKANRIYKQEEKAHLAWLRQHPDLREIEFETI